MNAFFCLPRKAGKAKNGQKRHEAIITDEMSNFIKFSAIIKFSTNINIGYFPYKIRLLGALRPEIRDSGIFEYIRVLSVEYRGTWRGK